MAGQSDHTLFRFLDEISIKDIPQIRDQKLVVFSSKADLSQCFDALVTNHILCAPVVEEDTKNFIGLLDMKDFVAYILYLFGGKGHPSILSGCDKETSSKDAKCQQKFDLAFVGGDLVDYSRRNPFVPIADDSSLGHALKEIVHRELYRMPTVAKDTNELVAMLSQSTIVGYLVENKNRLGNQINKTVQELNLGAFTTRKRVITVTEDTILLQVFELLWENRIHGCPVVSKENGQIIGNISVTDLQYSVNKNLQYLSFPVAMLLKDFESDRKKSPVVCSPDSTLIEVMEKLVQEKIHRIYIVDGENKPVGVITMIDIIDAILLLATGQGQKQE